MSWIDDRPTPRPLIWEVFEGLLMWDEVEEHFPGRFVRCRRAYFHFWGS